MRSQDQTYMQNKSRAWIMGFLMEVEVSICKTIEVTHVWSTASNFKV